MQSCRNLIALLVLWSVFAGGCALVDDSTPTKLETNGLIATPPSYYSTSKARYLAARYKDNLDRLVERIIRNPKTSSLQFANNISSVGGIGFFTHSATKTPDERYLEVVLATPETFEVKGEFSDKVQQLISRYGVELLGIVSDDNDIYQDRELSGYGLNLAWRNVVKQSAGNHVTLERAVIYFAKEKVRNYLRQGAHPNELLDDAVIFAVEEDGPLKLVSYRPQQRRPDVRPVIQEDNLAATKPQVDAELTSKSSLEKNPTPSAKAESVASDPSGAAAESLTGETKKIELPSTPPVSAEHPQPSAEEKTAAEVKAPDKPDSFASAAQTSVGMAKPVPEEKAVGPLTVLKSPPAAARHDTPAALPMAAKPLEGFIVQLAFNEKEKAQRWADSMVKRGFVVSLTEVSGGGTLRVRLGNFAAREDAERELRKLKQEGLNGIIVSLPQAFRPLARTSMP